MTVLQLAGGWPAVCPPPVKIRLAWEKLRADLQKRQPDTSQVNILAAQATFNSPHRRIAKNSVRPTRSLQTAALLVLLRTRDVYLVAGCAAPGGLFLAVGSVRRSCTRGAPQAGSSAGSRKIVRSRSRCVFHGKPLRRYSRRSQLGNLLHDVAIAAMLGEAPWALAWAPPSSL